MSQSSITVFLLFSVFVNDVISNELEKEIFNVEEFDGKIVGGYNTTIQNAPYQVFLLLQRGTRYFGCGGSIIRSKYVLTAAHCLTGTDRIFVRAGSTYFDYGGTQYNTTIFRQHPMYNATTSDYDVGLVRIPGGITLDGVNTRAVALPTRTTPIVNGSYVHVTGWGDTYENGQGSENLMAVDVPIVDQDVCQQSYPTLTSRQFCAGEAGKDSCQGDSGGPAVSFYTEVQLGIVSFGTGCARPGYPGVYTSVPAVRRWIRLNARV